jgi:hypothetical protein
MIKDGAVTPDGYAANTIEPISSMAACLALASEITQGGSCERAT